MRLIYTVYNEEDEFATKQWFSKLQFAMDYYKKMIKEYPKGKWRVKHKEFY